MRKTWIDKKIAKEFVWGSHFYGVLSYFVCWFLIKTFIFFQILCCQFSSTKINLRGRSCLLQKDIPMWIGPQQKKARRGISHSFETRFDPFFVEGNDFSRPWTYDMLIRARLESERTNISHESNRPSSDGGINWCLWWYFKKWFSHRRFEPGFRSEQWKKGFEFGSGWDVPRERKIRDFTRSTNGYSIWMVNIWVKISDSREALRKQVEKHTILLSYPLFNIQTLFSPLVKETSIACHSKCGFCFSPTSFDVAKSHRTIFDTIQVLVNFPFKWAVR